MLEVHAIKGPTGRLLKAMLDERGLLGGQIQGVVNYGYNGRGRDLPTLNENAGRQDKYQELIKLDDVGVRTIPFSKHAGDLDVRGIILGRKLHHTCGRDILFNPEWHMRDFYTQLVPKIKEFRIWAFRGQHLATYEKTLNYPIKNGRGGRNKEIWNWRNGYAYNFRQPADIPERLKKLGCDAVEALLLDFGAVDILQGEDRRFYVLEVNTAPGVEGRRQGLTSLVNCIERWAKDGFPARRN